MAIHKRGWRWSGLGRFLLPLVVLSSGCGGTPGASPSPSSSTPGPSASSPAGTGAVLAAVREAGTLELFQVTADGRSAQRLRILTGPAGAKARGVTVSGGSAPTVCAIWSTTPGPSLWCYKALEGDGHRIATGTARLDGALTLSVGGNKLAWSAGRDAGPPDIWYADLDNGAVSSATQVPAVPPGEVWEDSALALEALAWAGNDALLVSSSIDDDVNGALTRVPLAGAQQRGWNSGEPLQPDPERPIMTGAVSATHTSLALAMMAGAGEGFEDNSRAIEIDVHSGRVASIISTPAKGRNMYSVSGGELGVLYQTVGFNGDLKTYWREPGSAHGVPLSGLPADVRRVVAQS